MKDHKWLSAIAVSSLVTRTKLNDESWRYFYKDGYQNVETVEVDRLAWDSSRGYVIHSDRRQITVDSGAIVHIFRKKK